MARLLFTTGHRPTYVNQEATLRNFAKAVMNFGSGSLLARLLIPRARIVGVSNCSAWETLAEDVPPLYVTFRCPE
ncbi:hypothetical protein RB195_000807 [Necator americanus]|uniref:Uncharacterized protein n=1 Tax=Necator americanus TaxID=51031 RepID=A0ABR1DBY5_NECAM